MYSWVQKSKNLLQIWIFGVFLFKKKTKFIYSFHTNIYAHIKVNINLYSGGPHLFNFENASRLNPVCLIL